MSGRMRTTAFLIRRRIFSSTTHLKKLPPTSLRRAAEGLSLPELSPCSSGSRSMSAPPTWRREKDSAWSRSNSKGSFSSRSAPPPCRRRRPAGEGTLGPTGCAPPSSKSGTASCAPPSSKSGTASCAPTAQPRSSASQTAVASRSRPLRDQAVKITLSSYVCSPLVKLGLSRSSGQSPAMSALLLCLLSSSQTRTQVLCSAKPPRSPPTLSFYVCSRQTRTQTLSGHVEQHRLLRPVQQSQHRLLRPVQQSRRPPDGIPPPPVQQSRSRSRPLRDQAVKITLSRSYVCSPLVKLGLRSSGHVEQHTRASFRPHTP